MPYLETKDVMGILIDFVVSQYHIIIRTLYITVYEERGEQEREREKEREGNGMLHNSNCGSGEHSGHL